MRSPATRVVALAATLVIIIAACGGSDEFTTDELIGTWRTDIPSFINFNEDGSYSIGRTAEELESDPVDVGQFTLEGTVFTVISSEESLICAAGDRGTAEIELLDAGPSGEDRYKSVAVIEDCSTRGSTDDEAIFERVP